MRKKIAALLLMLVILLSCAVGIMWSMTHYVLVGTTLYAKDVTALDLREENLSPGQYRALTKKLPNCHILWSVPFQGKTYDSDVKELTLTTLSQKDISDLDHLTQLRKVDARQCRDYEALAALAAHRPELRLDYGIVLGEASFPVDSTQITLSQLPAEELSLLQYLTALETVTVTGGEPEDLAALRSYCHNQSLHFQIQLCGDVVEDTAVSLTLEAPTDADLSLLSLFPDLEALHLVCPTASMASIEALSVSRPGLALTWEQTIAGKLLPHDTAGEIDLAGANLGSIGELEAAMTYFPQAEALFLGQNTLDNEEIAALRERHREDYKVIWTVPFGEKLTCRTDTKDFFPARDGMYQFDDEDAYNLRYCEEIVCMDIGHMSVSDVSFLANMPDLEYLILAWTQVQRIDGIENCKKLKFLELDNSCIRDITPLAGCTALEDLNLGNTWPDVTPILGLTSLKNVYMIFGSGAQAYRVSQALPDCRVITSGNATVGSGWRQLPNYYAMRDFLGVEYMHG